MASEAGMTYLSSVVRIGPPSSSSSSIARAGASRMDAAASIRRSAPRSGNVPDGAAM